MNWTQKDIDALNKKESAKPEKVSKYNNVATTIKGIKFMSKKEANRYQDLRLLEQANEISNLRLQVKYKCFVNDMLVCTYIADFVYFDNATQKEVVEDVKGCKTAIYRLKKKLVLACLCIDILET